MTDSPFDPASRGAQRLARTALRVRESRTPTEILLVEDVLDLDGHRTLRTGERATVDRWVAVALVERGSGALAH
jgi:hypothetical protein